MGAGPEVVDHAGQACGEDVHAVHEPQRAPAHLQALLARLAEDSEAEVAVVALLDRGLQGAPAAGSLPSAKLFARCPAVPAEKVNIQDWKEMLKRAQNLQLTLRKRLN